MTNNNIKENYHTKIVENNIIKNKYGKDICNKILNLYTKNSFSERFSKKRIEETISALKLQNIII